MTYQEIHDRQVYTHQDLTQEFFQAPAAEVPNGRLPMILKTLEIQPTVNAWPMPIPKPLVQQYEQTMLLTGREQLPVRFLGYAPLFPGTRVYTGPENDWVMVNLKDDPLYLTNGKKLLAPQAVRDELSRIAATGLDFDAYYIAHEIPAGSMQAGQEIPLEFILPPKHPDSVRRVKTYAKNIVRIWDTITRGYTKLAQVGAVAGAAAITLPLSLGTLLALDPVLFGVHVDKTWHIKNCPLGMFYFLTAWNWSAEEK